MSTLESSPIVLESPAIASRPPLAATAGIAGLGVALPEEMVGNDELAPALGVDPAWIERRTGIRARRRMRERDELLVLAGRAGGDALRDAGVDAAELELVIFASISQERWVPTCAAQVATELEAKVAGAFDLGAACTGFVSGLATAAAFIEAGRARNVLLVAADALSRHCDPHDRATAALFGDGAGAVVLSGTGKTGIGAFALGADGSASELITNDPDTGLIAMAGHETFIHAVARMEQATYDVCRRAGVDLHADVDLLVFHQANARITRALVERLGCDPDKVVECIAELGNTCSASVPLALAHARANGRLSVGTRVLVCAVGAGLTWGAALLEWGCA